MLTIPRRYDNRIPLAAIASLLVLINASLIGFDFYQRNTGQSPGIFTASNTVPADTNDKDQKPDSTPTEQKLSEEKSQSPETKPEQTQQPTPSQPETSPDNQTPADAPVVVNSSPSQGESTFEPGRGGGGSPWQPESTTSSTTPSTSTATSPSNTETSDGNPLDAEKTLDSTITQVNPLLHEPDKGATIEIN